VTDRGQPFPATPKLASLPHPRSKEPDVIRSALVAAALFAAALSAPAVRVADAAALLDRAIAGDHRSEAFRARDRYRHPRETLEFFGLEPPMTVVEVWPAAGWFTDILAPVLKDGGKLYAARYAVSQPKAPEVLKERDRAFLARMASRPDVFGGVVATELFPPDYVEAAPMGQADMVLTFRNVHNWAKAGNAEAMFKVFFDLLKPGGVLGVEEHRARKGTALEEQIRTGYMTEEKVIELAMGAGFIFLDSSEVNANALDTKDWPDGVWTLPPTLRLGDKDREKYLAIGESDRMTLKFVKP
jgi:predicted methyltransferase